MLVRFLVLAVVGLLVSGVAWADEAILRPVRLQLKWLHQFQSAGFYAAIEQGYFREAGLEVTLLEGAPDRDPASVVLSSQADFGVGTSSLVIDRAAGKPLVAVAAILQHSPFVLLARGGEDLTTVHDLVGKTLMLEAHAHELLAYLALERVPLDRLTVVPYSGDWSRLGVEVDAMTAYTTSEPFDLRKARRPYLVFNPRASGIDFYGDTLFTTGALLANEPTVVAAMRQAVVKGWRYALEHEDEIIDLILARYAPELSRDRLAFEAHEMRRLMIPGMVEIGYMYEGRWRHIADGFAAAGLMPHDFSLAGFLYQPDVRPDLRWLYGVLALVLSISLMVAAVSWHVHRLNRALTREVAERRRLEEELRHLAATDSLTGAFTRRRWLEAAEQEIARNQRQNAPLAVLVLDLDHFKAINDRWGHPAGDLVLMAFAEACRTRLRAHDAFGRLGGEEFAVLLPATEPEIAREVADRIRRAVAERQVPLSGGGAVSVSVSIGISMVRGDEAGIGAALARADAALYQAKQDGRNRVSLALAEP